MTLLSLASWQFSQFALLTQVIAILILKWFQIINFHSFRSIILPHAFALTCFIIATQNKLHYHSFYACLLFCSLMISFVSNAFKILRLQMLLEAVSTIFGACMIKTMIFDSQDDSHIFDILKSKLTAYQNFHTLLYTCSAVFDFLDVEYFKSTTKTLLLPSAIFAGISTLNYWYRNWRATGFVRCIEPEIAYNYIQLAAFSIMAVFIMRLKLFMSPHLCLFAGLVANKRYLTKIGIKNESTRSALVVLLLALMVFSGLPKLRNERSHIGETFNFISHSIIWIVTLFC